METPLIVWGCTVAFIVALIIFRAAHRDKTNRKHRMRVFEIGNEREVFFLPGDPLMKNDATDYGDDF